MTPTALEPRTIAGIPAEWWLRLAHDLRGPVAPMRMAVQMMRGGWVSAADQEEALRMIDRQIDVLLGGIEDLGELMRLNAGAFSFQPQDADLGAVLDRVAGKAALERWLQDRQVRLVPEPPPGALHAPHDPQRLAALLEFLVRKAAQHAAPGQVLVLGVRGDGGRVRWSLHGSGPGLSKDPELRLLAGESDALEECEARCLLMREIARRHALVFEPLRDGAVGVSMDASP
jgi:signal transduction histidine kinase